MTAVLDAAAGVDVADRAVQAARRGRRRRRAGDPHLRRTVRDHLRQQRHRDGPHHRRRPGEPHRLRRRREGSVVVDRAVARPRSTRPRPKRSPRPAPVSPTRPTASSTVRSTALAELGDREPRAGSHARRDRRATRRYVRRALSADPDARLDLRVPQPVAVVREQRRPAAPGAPRQLHRHHDLQREGRSSAPRRSTTRRRRASTPFAELIEMATVRQLLDNTVASFDPKPVPQTFVGDVIFTPDSLDTLMNAVLAEPHRLRADEGHQPVSKTRSAAPIADTRLTVTNRPLSPEFPLASTFDSDGVPSSDLPIITDGVLENHLIDWYTSRKLERPMTAGVFALDVAPGDQILRRHRRQHRAGHHPRPLLGRHAEPATRLQRRGEELVLRRGRQGAVPDQRNDDRGQLRGAAHSRSAPSAPSRSTTAATRSRRWLLRVSRSRRNNVGHGQQHGHRSVYRSGRLNQDGLRHRGL